MFVIATVLGSHLRSCLGTEMFVHTSASQFSLFYYSLTHHSPEQIAWAVFYLTEEDNQDGQ